MRSLNFQLMLNIGSSFATLDFVSIECQTQKNSQWKDLHMHLSPAICNWYMSGNKKTVKGQLISKQNCRAKTSPKKRTKNCKDFCPERKGRNSCNFLFVFLEKFWLDNFVLKLTDL